VPRQISFGPGQEGVVKVMTFNVRTAVAFWDAWNWWPARKNAVVETLAHNAPDVAALQEAIDHQLDYICKALPQYAVYAVGRDDGKRKGETCAILYRRDRFSVLESGTFWFSDTPSRPGSRDWGSLFPRICSWVHLADNADNRRFYVYNVHLDNWSRTSRRKSLCLLAERIAARKTADPFLVMGDFNMKLDDSAMQCLRELGSELPGQRLADALQSAGSTKKHIGTIHGFTGWPVGPRIDHIQIGGYAQVLDANIDRRRINGRYPSDHFPVIATVRIPTAARPTATLARTF